MAGGQLKVLSGVLSALKSFSVCVPGFYYCFRTFSSIHSYLVRLSSPHGDQRPILIWWNAIFELEVKFRTKV